MTKLEELEEIVGSLESIELSVEPDLFTRSGTDIRIPYKEELENAIKF